MARKMLGVFTAVAAAMLLVGVAWAGTDGAVEELSSTEATAATIPDEGVTVPTTANDEDDDDTTSTSVHDDEDDGDTTTSTTIPGDTTSTSIHDDEDDDDDTTTSTSIHHDDEVEVFEDRRVVYDIPGVGSVTVEIIDGRLELVSVSAPGWDIEMERAEADRVEVEFERGSDEVEFEARIDHGKIEIEIELESS